MAKSSRTKKSLVNTTVGLIGTVLSSLLSFVLNAVFIRLLGLEYSGVNSIFADILKILNLADLGISNAILFRLYKSIANKDDEATELNLTVYRRVCYAAGIIVGVAGLCFVPFLNLFVHEQPSFPEPLWSLYLIVLATSVISHFISYRGVLFTAYQERYIATIIQYVCIFLRHGLQIVVLLVFKNIYLYLLVNFFTMLLRGIVSGILTHKRYHLSWHSKKKLPKEDAKNITKDVGALAVFKFCRTLSSTIDTFLIGKFVSVATTAIYGSTVVITSELNNLFGSVNDGMIASVGDLYARNETDRLEQILQMCSHLVYLLYGISAAVLVVLERPFMEWWIGHSLSDACIYVLIFNFCIAGQNALLATFRNAMGLYRKGWKRPAATVLINFVVSVVLIQRIGIIGAFIGTTVSSLSTIVWYDPYCIYKYGLKKSCKAYFVHYAMYIIIIAAVAGVELLLGSLLPPATTFLSLLWHGIVYSIVAAALLLLVGAFFPVQKELLQKGLDLIRKKGRKKTSVKEK